MSSNIDILIDIFVVIFASIGFLTSSGILFLIIYHQHRSRVNTPIFLICNTYVSIIFVSLILLDMYAHNLVGDLYENISFDDWWCHLRAYFLHVAVIGYLAKYSVLLVLLLKNLEYLSTLLSTKYIYLYCNSVLKYCT
jgi:hypothetical protein